MEKAVAVWDLGICVESLYVLLNSGVKIKFLLQSVVKRCNIFTI